MHEHEDQLQPNILAYLAIWTFGGAEGHTALQVYITISDSIQDLLLGTALFIFVA